MRLFVLTMLPEMAAKRPRAIEASNRAFWAGLVRGLKPPPTSYFV